MNGEEVGRMVGEGEIVHGADWTALWWTAVGSGMIVPAAEKCEPEIAVIEDGYLRGVRVKEGKVLHSGEVYEVDEEVIGLMNNLGKEERYDVIYLKHVEGGGVSLDVKMGEPCEEEALHPDLIDETGEIVTPIAVAYLEKDATEISELKDVRWIPNAEHSHRAGSGLELDEDHLMNVVTDEGTVLIENDELILGEVGGDELELNDGKGIDYYEYWDEETEEWVFVYRMDEDDGLYMGENEELVISPWAFVGEGLEVEEVDGEDRIRITDGDGLKMEQGELTTRIGLGTKISEDELTVDLKSSGGVTKGSSGISIVRSELAGSGIEEVSGNLGVDAGDGLQVSGDALQIVRGEGIKSVEDKVGLDLQTGGGLGINGDNALYVKDVDVDASSGLYEDGGDVNVGEGDGLTISSTGIYVNDGDGVRTDDGKLVTYVNPWNGVDLDGELSIDPSGFVGDGLYESNGKLHVNAGDGTKIDGGLAVNLKSDGGLRANSTLDVEPSDFAGGWFKDHMKVEDDQIEIDPSSVFNMIAETTVTIDEVGQREGIWIEDYTNRYPLVMGIAFLDQCDELPAGIQLKKVMIDENAEAGYEGNNVFCGVECVDTIGDLEPESAEVLIRVYEARMDESWSYDWDD